MKKTLGLFVLCGMFLVGCEKANDGGVTVSSTPKTSETTQAESSEEKTTSEVGKRSNPVPLGETATFDIEYYNDNGDELPANLSLSIDNVIRGQEAYDYLIKANEYNEEAPEGQEWVVFDVELKVNEGDEDEPYYEIGMFTPISSNGEEIPQGNYPTFSDGEQFGDVDLYEGGTAKGKFGILVPEGDDSLMEYNGNSFTTSVFFALK